MLSSHHSFKKLNILSKKRSKVDVKPIARHVSLDDLAFLVKRLSVQVDDLVEEHQKKTAAEAAAAAVAVEEIPVLVPPVNTVMNEQKEMRPQHPLSVSHTTVDPWASYVPQNYGALLQRLEDIEMLQKCPNECCASTGTVSSADGVPWPQPIEPFSCSTSHDKGLDEMLDIQYTHWCTLLRCLPLMDAVTCAHVKTVGLYAMREILKCKASHQRDGHCHPVDITTRRLRESMSCLQLTEPVTLSLSETKTALDEEEEGTGGTTVAEAPIPPPKETSTPTPSGYPSPHHSRFQKWVQYKRVSRKAHTDTTSTPMAQSQTLRKIGSWFF
ncbi:uncharacterized protein EV154DRAFT_479741 [Mucor mucedo]|uniref:uncharacterized protein n=1 Tax=Mucor mucedo TaxID=29922 RepID=UPI002220D2C7|nr:uncharacterized protein EV154DRAFT_479741 [Mucor mucedo]KAI7893070.1 hypothetical protein EV154DRAFT_479741 [Mucor mucedo]